MACAVAAPIPRLAPVTSAMRPASQCPGSPAGGGPGIAAADSPVELLVSIQAPFQVEMRFGMVAACCPGYPFRVPDAICGGVDVVRRDQEASHAVHDYLGQPAAPESDDGRPACLRVGRGHAE